MPANYVLIDYENVQPKNLKILKSQPFKVILFLGENQSKLSADIVIPMQALGENAEYVKINGNGPNALDFHIAYYVGELAAANPQGSFHIISKDRGFDPLIRHLNGKKIKVWRHKDLAEIPSLRIPKKVKKDELIDAIVKNLIGRGQSRPRKVKTLQNTISSLVSEPMDNAKLTAIVGELENRKFVKVEKGNVKYTLPSRP